MHLGKYKEALPLSKLFSLFLFCGSLTAQKTFFEQNCQKNKNTEVAGDRVLSIAKRFINKPYVAHTLDNKPAENLVVNFDRLDCATFVEQVAAWYLTEKNDCEYSQFQANLTKLRYFDGKIDGYGSRIHYFSQWLLENQKNGLQDITAELGGKLFEKKVNFMTSHRALYQKLSDKKALESVIKAEDKLNNSQKYYIPKQHLKLIENQLKNGDIVAFTSATNGLDINHEGFVVKKDGKTFLLHASLEKKKVIISEETLVQYIHRITKDTGVMIARFN